jgi:YHS domain-containing protein
MAKDPLCGMELLEKGANFMVHLDHKTFYFCTEKCTEAYELDTGFKKLATKGIKKFLAWLAKGTERSKGKKLPNCH